MKNKRGNILSAILISVFVIFVSLAIFLSFYNSDGSAKGFLGGLENAVEDSISVVQLILTPVFEILLGLDTANGNIPLLKILAFILVSIIVVGSLDSIGLFGEAEKGHVLNFVVGIIVAIIGVRFMPDNLWESLTAPSSAFVATIFMALPFIALFFVTMKFKSPLVRKLLWAFFVCIVMYILFTSPNLSKGASTTYIVFSVLAAIILVTDGAVHNFFRMERERRRLGGVVSETTLQERIKLRRKIKELLRMLPETEDTEEKASINLQIKELKKKMRDQVLADGETS
jgi:hypothetical protein